MANVSSYHGGAFVVFSKALNPTMTVLAVEGSFASVIGGAPAAAVVFAGDVNARMAKDPRVAELEAPRRRGDRWRAGGAGHAAHGRPGHGPGGEAGPGGVDERTYPMMFSCSLGHRRMSGRTPASPLRESTPHRAA
jgi:hypothetical protein